MPVESRHSQEHWSLNMTNSRRSPASRVVLTPQLRRRGKIVLRQERHFGASIRKSFQTPCKTRIAREPPDALDHTSGIHSQTEALEAPLEVPGSRQTVFGDPLQSKPRGVIRIVFENMNKLAPWRREGWKIKKARSMLRKTEGDFYLGAEVGANWSKLGMEADLDCLFRTDVSARSVRGYNKHDNIHRGQEGGTAIIGINQATSLVLKSGVDTSGLGRWSWMLLEQLPGHRTRLVSAYQPCANRQGGYASCYSQQRAYHREQGDRRCPRFLFRLHLITQLRKWRDEGDRIILMMDANEHILRGKFSQMLRQCDLDLSEIVHSRTTAPLPATFIRGSEPIDGAWCTPDLVCLGARFMPFYFGIGDHRAIIVDISEQSMVGCERPRIIRPPARRLQCSNERCSLRYGTKLQKTLLSQGFFSRLDDLYRNATYPPTEDFKHRLLALDRGSSQLMLHAESKCRKLHMGDIPFSEDYAILARRRQSLKALLRMHEKGLTGHTKVIKTAEKAGITNAAQLLKEEVRSLYLKCRSKLRHMRSKAESMRTSFLWERVHYAKQRGQKRKEKRLREIIRRERARKMWRHLRHSVGKRPSNSVTKVEYNNGATTFCVTIKEDIEQSLATEHRKRFTLAESAPIASPRNPLSSNFPHLADNVSVDDEATNDLMHELATLSSLLCRKQIPITITDEDYIRYWSRVKESTSSSASGLHFGHYKAALRFPYLIRFHAMKLQLALQTGLYFDRWANGMSVMLEKEAGVILVEKLRAILLMEADFNMGNKLIYGVRMMSHARKVGVIPQEHFAEKEKTAQEGKMVGNFFWDVSRQRRVPAAAASVDAANCYDRVNHAYASLVLQAFGVPYSAVISMLSALSNMQFSIRTGFGESRILHGGSVLSPYHGLCQGNGAAPAAWTVISSVNVGRQRRKGFNFPITSAISGTRTDLCAVLYVDDTDLLLLGDNTSTSDSVLEKLQDAVACWSEGLRASGGALKLKKCFHYLIDYSFSKGKWVQRDMVDSDTQLRLGNQPISRLRTSDGRKSLGLFTCPSGSMTTQKKDILRKCNTWLERVKNTHLPKTTVWTSFWYHLWPSLRWGLGTFQFRQHDLVQLLRNIYFQLLPYLGFNRHITLPWRTLPVSFYGIGLPDLSCEQTAFQINACLRHLGSETPLGSLMRTSLEQIILEVGIGNNLFNESFKVFGCLATPCWFTSLWEGMNIHGATLFLSPVLAPNTPLQRTGDAYLIKRFIEVGYQGAALVRLNRIRLFLQVYSVADITQAGGQKILNPGCLEQYLVEQGESSYSPWPKEKITPQDRVFWHEAIVAISSPSLMLRNRLGPWIAPPHRTHRWFCTLHPQEIFYKNGSYIQVFAHDDDDVAFTRSGPRYRRCRIQRSIPSDASWCTTVKESNDVIRCLSVDSSSDAFHSPAAPSNLCDFLAQTVNIGFWSNMHPVEDDHSWMATSLDKGTLLLVSDGSYNRHLSTSLMGVGWRVQCSSSHKFLEGAFATSCPDANSYRAELLGLYALLCLLEAILQCYSPTSPKAIIYCDNLCAIDLLSGLGNYIHPKKKHSDILRGISKVKRSLSFLPDFAHVKGHRDDQCSFDKLTLAEKLNCRCDELAKKILLHTFISGDNPSSMLQHEFVMALVEGKKVTSCAAPLLRFASGKRRARIFFHHKKIIFSSDFDRVRWDYLHDAIMDKSVPFRHWLTRHVSHFCGSLQMQQRCQTSSSSACPCCGYSPESAAHQLHCTDRDRTGLFEDDVSALESSMPDLGSSSTFLKSICSYLKHRGAQRFQDIPYLDTDWTSYAKEQDAIGWDNFLIGMVGGGMYRIVRLHLLHQPALFTADDWIKLLIKNLLRITSRQWQYRNAVRHSLMQDGLTREDQQHVFSQIISQLKTGAVGLLPEDKKMLDIDIETFWSQDGLQKKYWLQAVNSARRAKLAMDKRSTSI